MNTIAQTIEVCLESLEHGLLAQSLGATRIELCANLAEGGTTPSHGMIQACQEQLEIPIHVMLRCRAGNFDYREDEFQLMLLDAENCARIGVRGVVFGFLQEDGSLHQPYTSQMVQTCQKLGLKTTFHRAVDVCQDYLGTIHQLADLGVENVLTSGQALLAPDGIEKILEAHQQFGDQINVLAGAGIRPENVQLFLQSWITHIHFASHHYVHDQVNDAFEFGGRAAFDPEFMKALMEAIY